MHGQFFSFHEITSVVNATCTSVAGVERAAENTYHLTPTHFSILLCDERDLVGGFDFCMAERLANSLFHGQDTYPYPYGSLWLNRRGIEQ